MDTQLTYKYGVYISKINKSLPVLYVVSIFASSLLFGDGNVMNILHTGKFYYCMLALLVIAFANSYLIIRKNNLFVFLGFAEIFYITGYLLLEDNSFMAMSFLMIVIMIMFQVCMTIDLSDYTTRILQTAVLGVGFGIEYLIIAGIFGLNNNNILYGVLMMAILVFIQNLIYAILSMIVSYYDDKVFSQARLIEEVNSTNDQLVDKQEKINRANEQLGIQQVKLQAAYNKINRINSEMIILNDIIKCINETMDIKKLIEHVSESIINDLEVNVCAFSLDKGIVNNEKRIICIKSNFSDSFVESFKTFMTEGKLPGDIDGEGIYVDNQIDISRYTGLNTNLIGSLLVIPLYNDICTYGHLYVGYSKYNYFKENISFYESIVSQFLIGVKNIQIYARMEDMAVRDALTGIYNRRQLNKMVNDCIEKIKVKDSQLTSVLLDIDKFKNINDNYGHLFGDKVIKGIAGIVNETAATDDRIIAARYGGEEFVLVFYSIPFEDVCMMIEKLHEKVKKEVYYCNDEEIHVNVSIGISSYPSTCSKPDDVLNRSDWAMYYSKQHGRGRITIDNPEIDELRK